MEFIILGLAIITSLVSIGCFIMVLIKLFQEKGVLHGILGLICALYTFIWGWMNVDRLGIRTIMLVWTAVFVLGIILNAASAAFSS